MSTELLSSKQGSRAAARVAPAVVRLAGRSVHASGLVVSSAGEIVTTLHSLGSADTVEVTLDDGRTLEGRRLAGDPGTDLALVKVDAEGLTALPWRESPVEVGELVLTVGRPGKTARVTLGVVSAVGEAFVTPTGGRIAQYVDIDASLPRGFTGGPLIDLDGQLLGVNTPALARGGVLVPAITVARVVDALRRGTGLARGYLGLGAYPVRLGQSAAETEGLAGGLAVVSLDPGGPAEAGGVALGDIVLRLDGHPVDHPRTLRDALDAKADTEVTLSLLRGGAPHTLRLRAGARPASPLR
ncbi:MAG: trypsin-like peptidase domain-containing protein [Myxococcales bacterium]|nr:trypsin-like peptidase domain-containing protein [Myxococcales bacterium]